MRFVDFLTVCYFRADLSGPQVVKSKLQVQLSGMQRQSAGEQQDGEDGVVTPRVEKAASDNNSTTSALIKKPPRWLIQA